MRIIVTGACGSVGRCVVHHALAQGHQVIGIDLDINPDRDTIAVPTIDQVTSTTNPIGKYTLVQADLRDFEMALKLLANCDALIHLAAIRWPADGKVETHNTCGMSLCLGTCLGQLPRSGSAQTFISSGRLTIDGTCFGITRIAQASSINAIGLYYSQSPILLDYLPLDEDHPCRPDDPYSLSKVICEQQAETIVRRHPHIRIASLRPHHVVPSRVIPLRSATSTAWKHLWGYTLETSCARAFLNAITAPETTFPVSHQIFFVVEPDVASEEDIDVLIQRHWRDVPVRNDLRTTGFFDCGKLERMLGWKADSAISQI